MTDKERKSLILMLGPIYRSTAAHKKVKQTNVELIKSARRLPMWVLTFSSFALSWHLISDRGWAHIFIELAIEEAAGWYFPERAQAAYLVEGQSVTRRLMSVLISTSSSGICACSQGCILLADILCKQILRTKVVKKSKKTVVDQQLISIIEGLQGGWFGLS